MRSLSAAGTTFILLTALLAGLASPVVAREKLGYGRLISNDVLGDGRDRWRTGSVASSRVWGPSWTGSLPDTPGDLLELRFLGQIIGPDDLNSPAPGDRRYATALSLGLHSHFDLGGLETAIGGDLVMTGEETGLPDFQDALHDLLGVEGPSDGTRAAAVASGLHPTLVLESGRSFAAGRTELRPFVEGRVGDETLLRAGLDISFGQLGRGELLVRDPVTGQRYRVVRDEGARGASFVMGGDIARVASSIYLSDGELQEERSRLRAGMHWQGARSSGFYGLTWMGEEFSGQDEGQLIGSVRLKFEF
ncbi:MAG: lipid A deacylase LpxR family protein [Rhodobacteraceae bacterium]|nr:lipid A deacylase LpxR family protein [Paracoccaceae bacterium]MBR9820403.1 lipid A deacylase LpxR family protein [Paracoccaceae bacterium]